MSLYGLMFGESPLADAVLATLGRKRSDFGRFRDAGVADGKIYVYTRAGGGNRQCGCRPWDSDDIAWAAHDSPVKRTKTVRKTKTTHLDGGMQLIEPVEGTEDVELPVCQTPDSVECGCYGCFMTYRVHKLPFYSHDRDDEFDSTYATVYFDFPPEFAEQLKLLDAGQKFDPDKRWLDAIEAIKGAS